MNALQGLPAAQRGDAAVGVAVQGLSPGRVWAQGSGRTRVLQRCRVQGRVCKCCSPESGLGWEQGPLSCQGQQRAWRVPAGLWAGAGPAGTGGEALSLPGTLIKACGDARRRHPSLHTQITSYMCFIYCAVFN